MKNRISLLIIFCFLFYFNLFGQNNSSTKTLGYQIDSISIALKIDSGVALFHKIDYSYQNFASTTKNIRLGEIANFKVDKNLLIIGNDFFNLDKLLFFRVHLLNEGSKKEPLVKKYFEFYFEGY